MKQKFLIAITGIDSGIGKSLCESLLAKGFIVAGSYLETNPFAGNPGVRAFRMDLRNEAEIAGFAHFVIGTREGESLTLYGIVNNAGVALGGPVEDTPLSLFREVFEINFFGLVSFTQKMIPAIIEERGRICIVGSLAGRIALPFLSPYAASKFAVEGFCDSLRRELGQFGVRTIIFEPGGIATPIWEKAKRQDRSFSSRKYAESLGLFERKFIDSGISGWSCDLAAERIAQAIVRKKPRRRYIIDDHPVIDAIETFLPAAIIDRITAKWFGLESKP